MSKDLIEQIKMLLKHIQENPETLEKAKIFDLKTRKLLADTGKKPESKPQDFSIDKPSKPAQAAPSAKPAQTQAPKIQPKGAYAIKLKDGYLFGTNVTKDGQTKSPSHHDVLNWLKDKNIDAEVVDYRSVPESERKKMSGHIADLLALNDPHTIYETSSYDKTPIKIDAIIEKHPNSPDYKEDNYIPKKQISENTNFAFTPISSIYSNRFGTPEGNLWITTAKNLHTGEVRHSIANNKDESRLAAYQGKALGQEGNPELMPDIIGQKQHKGSLIAGANTYIRERIPFFILQKLDLHPFYEKTESGHRVGIMATDRNGSNRPMYVYSDSEKSPREALNNAINHFVLEAVKKHYKDEVGGGTFDTGSKEPDKKNQKLNTWLTHSIYRSPKVNLKDFLSEQQIAQKSSKDNYFELLKKSKVIDFQSRMPKKLKSPSLKTPKQTKTKKPSLKQTDPDELQRVLNDKGILTNYDMHILESRTKEIGDAIKMSDPNRDGDVIDNLITELDQLSDRVKLSLGQITEEPAKQPKLKIVPTQKSELNYFQALKKAKIYSFKDKKMLSDLPSTITPKEAQPIFRDRKKGITSRKNLKQAYSPNIMPEKQDVPGGEGAGKSEELDKGLKGDWKKEGYKISYNKPIPNPKTKYDSEHIFVAKDKAGSVVGSARFTSNDHIKGYIEGTQVHPKHRRKGLATAMYQMAEKKLKTKLSPAFKQSKSAKALWAQPTRPFGKSEQLNKNEKYNGPSQKVGYSTSAEWKPLHVIKNLEKERGNLWPVPTNIDHKNKDAIWVTHKPEHAIIYNSPSEFREYDINKPLPKTHELHQEFESYRKKLKNPKSHVNEVDLAGAKPVLYDGDGGYLYIKPKINKSENYYKNLIKSVLEKNLKPKYILEDLTKAKVFSLASGKLQFDTSKPEHKLDTTDPSHLMAAGVLPQGDPNRKKGMLVVGSNMFARTNLPKDILSNHDVSYHFFPTSELTWKVGATITERKGDKASFVEANGLDINQTLKDLNKKIEQRASNKEQDWHTFDQSKMNILNNHLYRQPKISLKDIQSLEPYKPE